jgi:acetyltransferase-like isoleucine patch superfamily enzyme
VTFRLAAWGDRARSFARKTLLRLRGMRICTSSILSGGLRVTWPHQVQVGERCLFEHDVYLKFDGIWSEGPNIIFKNDVFVGSGCEFNIRQRIVVQDDVLIASGSRFVDHDHGTRLYQLIRLQEGPEAEILIESGAWIGCNCVILKGVTIGSGSVIAAGAVVTKSVPPNEIWAGVPAKRISIRE